MNENVELLNFIYQNSQMGVITIKQLIGYVEEKEEEFKKHLESQLDEYQQINLSAKSLLQENGYDEKGIGMMEKVRTYLMINIQTLTDKSPSHLAEMLIIGSNMGIINAIKNIRKYKNANMYIVGLMERLLRFEENNVQELKKFL